MRVSKISRCVFGWNSMISFCTDYPNRFILRLSALNSKFDEIFTGEDNTATALDMLKYSIQETTIEPAYLAKVFYEAFDVTSEAGCITTFFQ